MLISREGSHSLGMKSPNTTEENINQSQGSDEN